MRSWEAQWSAPDTVWAVHVGIVTRNLLDRLIGMAPRPAVLRMPPTIRLASDMQGVQTYADLRVIYDETCPMDSVWVISDEPTRAEGTDLEMSDDEEQKQYVPSQGTFRQPCPTCSPRCPTCGQLWWGPYTISPFGSYPLYTHRGTIPSGTL